MRGVIGLQGSAFTGSYYDLSVLHHARIHGGEVCGAMVSGLIGPSAPNAEKWETLWHYMQGGPGVFRGDLHFYAEEGDLRGKLARIDTARCPVALLCGEFDYSCRPEDTRATAAAIPGATAVIIAGPRTFPDEREFRRAQATSAAGAGADGAGVAHPAPPTRTGMRDGTSRAAVLPR